MNTNKWPKQSLTINGVLMDTEQYLKNKERLDGLKPKKDVKPVRHISVKDVLANVQREMGITSEVKSWPDLTKVMDAAVQTNDKVEAEEEEIPTEEEGESIPAQYVAKFGQAKYDKLPPKFKNDEEWLASKLED